MNQHNVEGPDYCLECHSYMALTDGACPKCNSKNYIKWAANLAKPHALAADQSSLPRTILGVVDAYVSISNAGEPSATTAPSNPVHPNHYKLHPSGIECITITEWMTKNLGCAVDYIWRFPHTQNLKDLEKARWYIEREIKRLGDRK